MKLWKIKLQKIVGNLCDIKASKIVHERNGHLEIFSRPQVIENSRQYLLLRTDILQKTIVGYPCVVEGDSNFWICDHWKWTFSLWQYFLMVLPVVSISLFEVWIFLHGGHYVKLIAGLWLRLRVVVFYAPVGCQAHWCYIIFLWDNLVCQLGKIVPLLSVT